MRSRLFVAFSSPSFHGQRGSLSSRHGLAFYVTYMTPAKSSSVPVGVLVELRLTVKTEEFTYLAWIECKRFQAFLNASLDNHPRNGVKLVLQTVSLLKGP